MSKNRLKWKIKGKLENEKSWKDLLIWPMHWPRDDLLAGMSTEGARLGSLLRSNKLD